MDRGKRDLIVKMYKHVSIKKCMSFCSLNIEEYILTMTQNSGGIKVKIDKSD